MAIRRGEGEEGKGASQYGQRVVGSAATISRIKKDSQFIEIMIVKNTYAVLLKRANSVHLDNSTLESCKIEVYS